MKERMRRMRRKRRRRGGEGGGEVENPSIPVWIPVSQAGSQSTLMGAGCVF